MSVGLTLYADEAQASGFADIHLTEEAVWPCISQGRKSYRQKGKHSIKINEDPVEEYCVMNDVGNGGDHVLTWKIWEEEKNRRMEENHTLYLDFNSQNKL